MSNKLRHDFNRTVVITVVAVLIVQTTINDVASVVAVWHSFVSTAFTVNVVLAVKRVVALGRVLLADFQDMLINVVAVWVV